MHLRSKCRKTGRNETLQAYYHPRKQYRLQFGTRFENDTQVAKQVAKEVVGTQLYGLWPHEGGNWDNSASCGPFSRNTNNGRGTMNDNNSARSAIICDEQNVLSEDVIKTDCVSSSYRG